MTINKSVIIISNNPIAAAMLSSVWAESGRYVTVLEPPRMDRPDVINEVSRVMNVIQRISPSLVICFNIDVRAKSAIDDSMPIPLLEFNNIRELSMFGVRVDDWISLKAEQAVQKLYSEKVIKKPHSKAVVYNGESDINYVIAANYAVLHQADLIRLNAPKELLNKTIDCLNKIDSSLNDDIRRIDVAELASSLMAYIPDDLVNAAYERVLIVTEGIPFGLAMEGVDVLYANNLMLGHFLAHNIYEYDWGLVEKIGLIGLFVVDKSIVSPSEYKNFCTTIGKAKGLPKKFSTNNPKLAELEIMTLPYDILYLATHGKQLDGYEEEYNFLASDRINHLIKIDRAHGIIGVVIYIVSVDGIMFRSEGWSDIQAKAWGEFMDLYIKKAKPLPSPKSSISKKLQMRSLVLGNEPGMNSPFAVQRLASSQRPIVIANACGSWNEMSMRFIFAGASAYIGTLWATKTSVANRFASILFKEMFNIPLDESFIKAKNSLDDNLDKKNYVMTGSFENKYDSNIPFSSDGYSEVTKRIKKLLSITMRRLKEYDESTPKDIKNNTEIDKMLYKNELLSLKKAEVRAQKNIFE